MGEYDVQAIKKDLKQKAEIDPYKYDGSYELMRDTVGEYSALPDYSILDYHDLNLVYIMAVGTWKQGIESKKKNVQDSHLPESSKGRLVADLDHVWQNAVDNKYSNHESAAKTPVSVGMFGTGFFSFQNKTTNQDAQAFIKMCVDISHMDQDEEMFDRAAQVLTSSFHGMGAAAASIVLHCLKPYSFPILNSMEGNPNIFEVLGINIVKPGSVETYIDNCRKIKAFRDQNFAFKNYRIFDLEAGQVENFTKKNAWLLSWNKNNWDWENFDQKCADTKRGRKFTDSWACANTNPRVGDECFLIKLGDQPRGIIAHGTVVKESYETTHYDAAKAAAAKKERCIDVEFDRLINYAHDPIVTQDELEEKCSGQHWSPQGSGIAIKEGVLPELRELWKNVANLAYGFNDMVLFLGEYAGKHYVAPEKAGDQRTYMERMRKLGQKVRNEFITFGKDVADAVPELEYDWCANWVNQGQAVQRYLWVELKNKQWMDAPQSISMSVIQYPSENDSDLYVLTVRTEIRDANASEADYKRQQRLLEMPLTQGLQYLASYQDGSYHSYDGNTDRETIRSLCENGTIKKIEAVRVFSKLDEKDAEGQILSDVIDAVNQILPYYKHIMEDDSWWPSIAEYDPGLTKEQYKQCLKDPSVVRKNWLEYFYYSYQLGGAVSCDQLVDRFGGNDQSYRNRATNAAQQVQIKTGCPKPPANDNGGERYWPVMFVGKYTTDTPQRRIWKMRPALMEAVQELVDEGFFNDIKAGDNAVNANENFSLNTILYGPPGTGKTYNSVNYAVAICDSKSLEEVKREPYSDVLSRYHELEDAGRIAFTTFHQSYGYEEFIEGIKPNLDPENSSISYSVEDGIFKSFCNNAKAIKVQQNGNTFIKDNPRIWGMILERTQMNPTKRMCFDNGEVRLGWSNIADEVAEGDYSGDNNFSSQGKHMVNDFINTMEPGDIVVTEGSNKSIDAVGIITGQYEHTADKDFWCKRTVQWLVKDIDQDITQYLAAAGRKQMSRHSLFAFDYIGLDVISDILKKNGSSLPGQVVQETKPFVFIIDEINRGNISKIFGELITLIEDTKRSGAAEAMEAKLPYSGDVFAVPQNVYILGTMNTADRSIALIDTALRRRFSFVEMMPDSEVLNGLGVGTIEIDGQELNVAKMLDIINKRIDYLFDREHTIGHAFFTRLAKDPSIETLAQIFEKNVIPLLQEYFYEDYGKIQLVLGDNGKEDQYKFILDEPIKDTDIFNGNPDVDLPEKHYMINKSAFTKIESYKGIAKDL